MVISFGLIEENLKKLKISKRELNAIKKAEAAKAAEKAAKIKAKEEARAEKDEVITFITNNFELGSLDIANIYRNRWQIETFFKWIKRNLTIKALWRYFENTVKIHLWIAII